MGNLFCPFPICFQNVKNDIIFLRYILKWGFLDGKEGFLWHILQGFWYRMLVDAKIYELKKKYNNEQLIHYLEGFKLSSH